MKVFQSIIQGEFLFYFILKGSLRLSDSEGKTYRLNARESFVLPNGENYFIEADENLEFIRVALPE